LSGYSWGICTIFKGMGKIADYTCVGLPKDAGSKIYANSDTINGISFVRICRIFSNLITA
jgi:hypothetical protein